MLTGKKLHNPFVRHQFSAINLQAPIYLTMMCVCMCVCILVASVFNLTLKNVHVILTKCAMCNFISDFLLPRLQSMILHLRNELISTHTLVMHKLFPKFFPMVEKIHGSIQLFNSTSPFSIFSK